MFEILHNLRKRKEIIDYMTKVIKLVNKTVFSRLCSKHSPQSAGKPDLKSRDHLGMFYGLSPSLLLLRTCLVTWRLPYFTLGKSRNQQRS